MSLKLGMAQMGTRESSLSNCTLEHRLGRRRLEAGTILRVLLRSCPLVAQGCPPKETENGAQKERGGFPAKKDPVSVSDPWKVTA